jgi:hypothetical protein
VECAEWVEWVEVVLREVAETGYDFALLDVQSVRKVIDPRQPGLS